MRVETQAANRQALLDAARTLVAEDGASVPVGVIAQAAGLTTGAIYSIFGSKNALLVALLETEIERITPDTEAVDADLDLAATVERYVDAWFEDFVQESVAQAKFEFQVFLAAASDESLAARIGAMLEQESEQLAALFTGRQTGRGAGRLTTPEEGRVLAAAVKATVTGFALRNTVLRQDRDVVRRACLALTQLAGG